MDVVSASQHEFRMHELMTEIVTKNSIVRDENLLGLREACLDLQNSLEVCGLTTGQARKAWEAGVSGSCLKCGARISGESLHALCMASDDGKVSGVVRRLRLGYCVNIGCEGWLYRLEFRSCPEMDWPKFFEERKRRAQSQRRRFQWPLFAMHPFYQRMVLGVFGLILLLAIREWRMGGEIPIIRQAQHFKVDIAPAKGPHGSCGQVPGLTEE